MASASTFLARNSAMAASASDVSATSPSIALSSTPSSCLRTVRARAHHCTAGSASKVSRARQTRPRRVDDGERRAVGTLRYPRVSTHQTGGRRTALQKLGHGYSIDPDRNCDYAKPPAMLMAMRRQTPRDLKSLLRTGDSIFQIPFRRQAHLGDHLVGIRKMNRHALDTTAPLAANEILVLHCSCLYVGPTYFIPVVAIPDVM